MKLDFYAVFNIFADVVTKCAVRLKKKIILLALIISGFGLVSFQISEDTSPIRVVKAKDTFKYYIKGKVLDVASGVEISGAVVKVEYKHRELSSAVSGENGDYELKFESADQYTGAELEFIITRDGYHDKRVSNVPLRSGEPIIANFKMERRPMEFKRDPDAKRWETIEYLKEWHKNR